MNLQPPLPDNELARLDALDQYQILDTPAEKTFDDFTFLAAQICATPIAITSFIDSNRKWFKSKIGVTASEVSRDVAFCAYTVMQKSLLIVEDSLTDQRFATSPLVTDDPHIRFYAGAPLVTPEGFAIGTLCVIDTVPRQLSREQAEALQGLSRQVITQLELRRNVIATSRRISEQEQMAERLRRQYYFINAFYHRGVDKSRQGDYVGAIADFDQFLRLNPKGTNAYYDRGFARCKIGDYTGAIADFDQFLQMEPANTEAYRYRGLARSVIGDYLGAMADYSRAMQSNSSSAVVDYDQGTALAYLGGNQAGIISTSSQSLPSSHNGTHADLRQENTASSSKQPGTIDVHAKTTSSLPTHPDEANTHHDQGAISNGLGEKQRALEDFNQVLQIDPHHASAYYNRGVLRNELGEKQGALEDFNQVLQIDPHHASAYYNRGFIRNELGEKQGALEDFNQAIQIDPHHASAYYNRGFIRNELRDKQGALEDFNQAIQINPSYAKAYNGRGVIYHELGNKQRALEDFNQALQINPNQAAVYYNRGVICYELGDKQKAIEDFDQTLKLNPNYAKAYNNRGVIRYHLGDKRGAIEDFQKATNIYLQQGNRDTYQESLNRINEIYAQFGETALS